MKQYHLYALYTIITPGKRIHCQPAHKVHILNSLESILARLPSFEEHTCQIKQ